MELIYKDECYAILGACFEVYNDKGCGFLEAVYYAGIKDSPVGRLSGAVRTVREAGGRLRRAGLHENLPGQGNTRNAWNSNSNSVPSLSFRRPN